MSIFKLLGLDRFVKREARRCPFCKSDLVVQHIYGIECLLCGTTTNCE